MFVAFLFIPVVAGNVFMEDSIPNVPEITERQSTWTRDYTIFDPCNTNKPGNRSVSCSQLKRQGHNETRVYKIYILGKPVDVRCDMTSEDGGGWTVIQRRTENEESESFFEKDLEAYKRGFGTAEGSFWIGLEDLHALTSYPNNQQALKIELKRHDGSKKETVVLYNKFHVGSEGENYNLTIDEYDDTKSTSYNALSSQNGYPFTIRNSSKPTDRDCRAGPLSGGWWLQRCNEANLNGRKSKLSTLQKPGIIWKEISHMNYYEYTYDKVEMKIRDADFGFCTGSLKS
uniref:Putative ficolin/ixoderin n=1 Tax=Ixodes ricinus TaxID=34613 RepID=A0A0K8R7B5_IXORI